jgi:hypothetical protein
MPFDQVEDGLVVLAHLELQCPETNLGTSSMVREGEREENGASVQEHEARRPRGGALRRSEELREATATV